MVQAKVSLVTKLTTGFRLTDTSNRVKALLNMIGVALFLTFMYLLIPVMPILWILLMLILLGISLYALVLGFTNNFLSREEVEKRSKAVRQNFADAWKAVGAISLSSQDNNRTGIIPTAPLEKGVPMRMMYTEENHPTITVDRLNHAILLGDLAREVLAADLDLERLQKAGL